MSKIRNYLTKNYTSIIAIFITLLIASTIALVVNKPLYFSEYNDRVVVQIIGESDNKDSILDNIVKLDNISKIDRENYIIEFEYVDFDKLKEDALIKFEEKVQNTDQISLEITQVKKGDLEKTLISTYVIILFIFLSVSLISFVIRSWKFDINLKQLVSPYFSFLLILLASLLLHSGLISLMSRVYQIREIDINWIVVLALYITILLVIGTDVQINEDDNFVSINKKIFNQIDSQTKNALRFALIVIIFGIFGLGINFIIPGSLIFTSFVFVRLTSFVVLNFDKSRFVKKINEKESIKPVSTKPSKKLFTGKKVKKVNLKAKKAKKQI